MRFEHCCCSIIYKSVEIYLWLNIKIFSILEREIISVKFIMYQKFVYICLKFNTKEQRHTLWNSISRISYDRVTWRHEKHNLVSSYFCNRKKMIFNDLGQYEQKTQNHKTTRYPIVVLFFIVEHGEKSVRSEQILT